MHYIVLRIMVDCDASNVVAQVVASHMMGRHRTRSGPCFVCGGPPCFLLRGAA